MPANRAKEIENLVVPWEQAVEMVFQGAIQDAKTIIGLLYYDRQLNSER